MSNALELTVLMPCLNEARTLARCINKAQRFFEHNNIRGEVLIADNGSTDGSQQIASSAGARVVNVPIRGYGAALLAGIQAAQGKFVIMGDSDDSYDFFGLSYFVQALRRGDQLVMGNRFAGGIAPGAMPALHKYLGNPLLSFVGRLFFRSPIRDFHCGLRGFDRQAILNLGLVATGMEFASEMIVKATLSGLKISEVPTKLAQDGRGRPPHLRSWRDGWRHLRFLLIHAPAWLFFYPGLVLIIVGLIGSGLLFRGPLALGVVTLDIHSFLYFSVAACMGLQMVLLAGATSSHAVQINILPAMPSGLGWMRRTTLEAFLMAGLFLFLAGFGLAVLSVFYWSRQSFSAISPEFLMRVAIPSAAFMFAAGQVATSGFLFEFIRLAPRPSKSTNAELARSQSAENV
ncbi:MAG: glycosyltransferase family 2 protein [Burkholderiales bacterium]|nr:glycosyltransferase family 2 protein [Burkholderiales bacterium]